MTWHDTALVFGGLGLFLLGMSSMTSGLKEFAGASLKNILARFTKGRLTSIATGFLFTAAIQSSSATSLAVIGFINAGLLNLSQALGVIYGANLGTTLTGWLVNLLGFKLNISSFALPAIGLGAMVNLIGKGRLAAAGPVLAGFGLLFLGIDTMQQGMAEASGWFALSTSMDGTFYERFILVATGTAMTIVMQSSSAALAITLTALSTGLIQLPEGAALAIGQNIGTTSTAILASIGATSGAKRAAAGHVLFNLVTAFIALIFFQPLIQLVLILAKVLGVVDQTTLLAVFHTVFNILGLLIMAPLVGLTTKVLIRIIKEKETPWSPRFLDNNVLAVPELAIEAAEREFTRLKVDLIKLLSDTIRPLGLKESPSDHYQLVAGVHGGLLSMLLTIVSFLEKVKTGVTTNITARKFSLIRVADHFRGITEQCRQGVKARSNISSLYESLVEFRMPIEEIITKSAKLLGNEGDSVQTIKEMTRLLHKATNIREDIREKLFQAVAENKISATEGVFFADYINALARIVYHLQRAIFYWNIKEWEKEDIRDEIPRDKDQEQFAEIKESGGL